MDRSRKPLALPALILAVTAFLSLPSITGAAEWTASAAVAPAIEYTDNVCLSADNEKGEWVGLVTPSAGIQGNGRRANLSVSASVELNSLSDGDLEDRGCGGLGGRGFDNRNQYAPTVNAAADAILIENWLFIDANVTADQNEVSPFVSGGDDSLDRTGNTNTTYRYSISPYIQRRFKNTADLTIRYTYDDQYNSKDVVGDSAQHSAQFVLAGGPDFSPLSWSLQGDYSKVDYSDADRPGEDLNNDSELKSAQLNLGYQLNRAWQINGYYGQEWNDFVSSRDDIDGDFWDVGVRWTPNARTTVEAGTGDRFFGSTPRFSINYRHKRSVLTASYNKDLTYNRDIRTRNDPGSGLGGNSTIAGNSPLLDERFTLGYGYQGRRSGLNINASYSDQTRAEGGQDTVISEATFKDVSMSVNRSLSRFTTVSLGIYWDEQEPKGSSDGFATLAQNSETWRATLGLGRQLNNNMNLYFDYQYTDRQSDSGLDEYTENRFTLTLNINL